MLKKLVTIYYLTVVVLITYSCNKNHNDNTIIINDLSDEEKVEEQKFVINDSFLIGDVRRYGVFPNKKITNHPLSKKHSIQTVLDLSEKIGLELFFPRGFYDTSLIFDSRAGIKIRFNHSEFSDVIHITNERGGKSENIILKGTLITYDRFGTYHSNNILIDTLIIKSNTNKNRRKLRSRGCHIYTNTTNLEIKYLQVDDLGNDHPNNHAALAIDSYPNYPKSIKIGKAILNSSDRHGAYIMGFNHMIDSLIINNYAIGNSKKRMSLMQGAAIGEEKNFSGIWFNECYNTTINYLEVNSTSSLKNKIDVNFDIGDKNYPIIIKELIHNFEIRTNKFSGDHILKN